MHSRFAVAAAIAASALVLAPTALAHPTKVRGPMQDPKHSVGRSTSSNWSGWDVTGGGVSEVEGSWVQPTATCASGENSWSSPWIGIDGDTSSTVEQIGTDSDCVNGVQSYYAWYEMYPKGLVQLTNIVVNPGDTFTAKVSAGIGGTYTMTLTDTSTGATATTTQTGKKTHNASAEWVMEGPSRGLLTDFTNVAFSGAKATINGQASGLSSLATAQPIQMVARKTGVRAQPSAVTRDGFSVDWLHG